MRFSDCHPDRQHWAKGLCKRCYHSQYEKQRYANDPAFKLKQREHHLRSAYGLSLDDYQRMLDDQGGHCKLCTMEPNRNFGVDHDHVTGRVRGILCRFCNSKLGWYENRRQQIEEYIKE